MPQLQGPAQHGRQRQGKGSTSLQDRPAYNRHCKEIGLNTSDTSGQLPANVLSSVENNYRRNYCRHALSRRCGIRVAVAAEDKF